MSRGYIRSLDGIRAIAIILVMSFHAELNHFGWLGVQLFFVLSGYLITGILWKEKFAMRPTTDKLKKFWVRRSLRIFPLYFGFLIAITILYLLFHFPSYYTTYIPYLATYTFNYTRTFAGWEGNPLFTHLWSLSIEEQFYLFFPLLVFTLPAKWLKGLMVSVIVLAPLIRYGLGLYFQSMGHPPEVMADAVYWHTLSHLDAFFMGGAITVFSLDRSIKSPGRLAGFAFLLAVVVGALSFYLTGERGYFGDLGFGHARSTHLEYVWEFTFLNFAFAAIILWMVSVHASRSFIHRLFEQAWIVRIGQVSYGMYIFHWAVLVYGFARVFPMKDHTTALLLFIPYVVVVYLVAELSFRFFESPFIRLKDRFFPSSPSRPAADLAVTPGTR